MSMSTYQMLAAQNLSVVRLRNLKNEIEMMNQKAAFNNLYFSEWAKCYDNYSKVIKEKLEDFDNIAYGEKLLASIPCCLTEEEEISYDTKKKIVTAYIENNKCGTETKTEVIVPQKRLIMTQAKAAI